MPTDLSALAGRLRTQLNMVHALGRIVPSADCDQGLQAVYVDFMDTFEDPEAGSRIRQVEIRLSPIAAEQLSWVLSDYERLSEARTDTGDGWANVDAATSKIEGFTAGEPPGE